MPINQMSATYLPARFKHAS
nr:unnamed protein product [Callosobruchus analis]